MSVTSSLGRITSTLAAMLYTRLDLISVELEEEFLRFSSYFIYTLIALFCGGVAVLLALLLIIALFWDGHRILVLLSLITFFGVASLLIATWLRTQIANKPRLFEQSIGEFKKDAEMLLVRDHKPDQAE